MGADGFLILQLEHCWREITPSNLKEGLDGACVVPEPRAQSPEANQPLHKTNRQPCSA